MSASTAEYLAADKGPQAFAVIVIFTTPALLVVGLRLFTRFYIVRSPSHEDYAIVAAMIFSIGCGVCQIAQIRNGMGRHVEAVTEAQISASLKALYASMVFYNIGLTATKISILLQYLRIATQKPMRLICWGSVFFAVAVCIEALIVGFLQCQPVAKFWDSSIPGTCVNKAATYYANAAINIAQDISLVMLPFFMLRHLAMPKREKISLMAILALGGVATVASICRLHSLYILNISKDVTWDNPGAALWSAIELNIGIICASMPMLRALFIKIWPTAFLSSFNSRRANTDPAHATKGQYYNMEGSIMVKKTIAVQTSKAADEENQTKSYSTSQYDRPVSGRVTVNSEEELAPQSEH